MQFVIKAFLFLAFSSLVFGQSLGALDGSVLDEKNNPLSGAVITAVNKSNGISRGSITNSQGRYRLLFLEPGRYSVSIKLDGYLEKRLDDLVVSFNASPLVFPPIILNSILTNGSTQIIPGDLSLIDLTNATNKSNYDSNLLRSLPLG